MKCHSETKGYMKCYSETKGYMKCHSETKGYMRCHSEIKKYVKFSLRPKDLRVEEAQNRCSRKVRYNYAVEWVAILFSVRGVPGSILRPETAYFQ
jgi:hypothetical protein